MAIKIFSFIFLFYILSLFFVLNKAYAAVSISHGPCPPASDKVSDSFCSGAAYTECWNSENVGATNCGTFCINGSTWSHYQYDSCYVDPNIADDYIACEPRISDTCSTGDKYNSSNASVMDIGFCNCTVGIGYKTCCAVGGGTEPATSTDYDPYSPPEAYCPGASTGICGTSRCVYCGQPGQPACGAPACNSGPTSTPTPTSGGATPTDTPGTPTPTPTDVPPSPQPDVAPPLIPAVLNIFNPRTGVTVNNVLASGQDTTSIIAQNGDVLRIAMQFKNRTTPSVAEADMDLVFNIPSAVALDASSANLPAGCTANINRTIVTCADLYQSGGFNSASEDQREFNVIVNTTSNFSIPAGYLLRKNRYTKPTYLTTERHPSNDWGSAFPSSNLASDFTGNFRFDTNSINVNLPGPTPTPTKKF